MSFNPFQTAKSVEKAMLILTDYRGLQTDTVKGRDVARVKEQLARGSLVGGSLGSSTLSETDFTNVVGDTSLADLLKESSPKSSSEKKVYQVQFNPSKLEIYTEADMTEVENAVKSEKGETTATQMSVPSLVLSTTLYFDAMSEINCFGDATLTAGISSQMVKNIVDKKKVSTVMPQVEGLTAALRNPFTRHVAFHWAEFEFIGVLDSINAQYTMFSTTGQPVRATANLRLRLEIRTEALSTWQQSFNACFGTVGVTSYNTAAQKYGSLINLG